MLDDVKQALRRLDVDLRGFVTEGRFDPPDPHGKPLPTGREIFTVHYRVWEIVKETGLSRQAKDMLERHAGVRRLAQLSKQS